MSEKPKFMTLFEASMESNLPGPARAVFNVIAKRYNYQHERDTWVGHKRLATDTGFSVSTVKRQLAVLEEYGWVTVTGVQGNTSRYEPHIGRVYEGSPKPNLVQSDLGVGQSELGSGQSDLGGSSERPTNGEDNGELNGEKNEEAPAAPVGVQEDEPVIPLSIDEVEETLNTEEEKRNREFLGLESHQRTLYINARKNDPLGFDHDAQMKKYENPDYALEW